MDCNTSVLSILKNTNMNIRKKKKMKKINGKTWQLVPEQAASQTLASLEGTGRKTVLTEALQLEYGEFEGWGVNKRFPLQWSSLV